MARPRKAWQALSDTYRRRLTNAGITPKQYSEGKSLSAARGHAKTPEHPERATRNPAKFPEYLSKRSDEMRQLIARKERVFGDRIKYRARSSERHARTNPQPSTGGKVNQSYVRRFLRMTEDQILLIDWSNDEWGFLFYH